MRLKSVVLPAPFGPMIAWIAPLRTWKLTSLTATSPPKPLVRPLTSRTSSRSFHSTGAAAATGSTSGRWTASRSAAVLDRGDGDGLLAAYQSIVDGDALREQPVEQPRQAAREDKRDAEHDDAEHGVPEHRPLDHLAEDEQVEEGAGEGPEEIARAADQRHDQSAGREAPVDLGRVHLRLTEYREPTRDRREGRRDHEGRQLIALHPETGELGATAVLADSTQCVAKRGLRDHVHGARAEENDAEDEPVELVGVEERIDPVGGEDAVRPVRAAREALPAVRDCPDELADTEGEQREVELPAPEYDQPDDESRGGSHQRREGQPDQRVLEKRDLFGSRDAHEIGAEGPEHRVAEADEADVCDEEVDAEREQPEIEGALRDDVVAVACEQRDQACEDDHREPEHPERFPCRVVGSRRHP